MNLDDFNTSELTVLASNLNANVHRGLPREVLVAIIQGEDVELPPRRVDSYRHHIFTYVDKYWDQVEPLISCPLKSRHPRSCFRCSDIQVGECTTQNPIIFETNSKE